MLAQLRKEYEMLRIEFEQNLAANEQTGPINREMRHLITSLQNHISQLKGEIARYKRKYKESSAEVTKVSVCSPGEPLMRMNCCNFKIKRIKYMEILFTLPKNMHIGVIIDMCFTVGAYVRN